MTHQTFCDMAQCQCHMIDAVQQAFHKSMDVQGKLFQEQVHLSKTLIQQGAEMAQACGCQANMKDAAEKQASKAQDAGKAMGRTFENSFNILCQAGQDAIKHAQQACAQKSKPQKQ